MQYFQPEILFLPACFLVAYAGAVIWRLLPKFAATLANKVKMKTHAAA